MACDCFRNGLWRKWFRAVVILIYLGVFLGLLPVVIWQMIEHDSLSASRRIGFFIAAVFVLLTIPLALWDIGFHLYHYTMPELQKYVIRVLWMVPVYSACSWIGLRFDSARVYMESIVGLYEAFTVYSFMCYLSQYLVLEYDIIAVLEDKDQVKHFFPFCYLERWKMGRELWQLCRFGVYQYVVVNLVLTIISFICELAGKYEEGTLSLTNSWLYICFVTNVSQIWAIYCLVLFYKATKKELAPIRPFWKFLLIKAVVFFSFWQSVALAILQGVGAMKAIAPTKDDPDSGWTSSQIQELLICIEMFIAGIAHHYVFSYRPYVDLAAERPPCCTSFWRMFDVRDIHDETLEHAYKWQKLMKKRQRSETKEGVEMSERAPLIGGQSKPANTTNSEREASSSSSRRDEEQNSYQEPQLPEIIEGNEIIESS